MHPVRRGRGAVSLPLLCWWGMRGVCLFCGISRVGRVKRVLSCWTSLFPVLWLEGVDFSWHSFFLNCLISGSCLRAALAPRSSYIWDKNNSRDCQVFLCPNPICLFLYTFQNLLIVAFCGSRVLGTISRRDRMDYVYSIWRRTRSCHLFFFTNKIEFVFYVYYFFFELLIHVLWPISNEVEIFPYYLIWTLYI